MPVTYNEHNVPIIETTQGKFALAAAIPTLTERLWCRLYDDVYPTLRQDQWQECDYRDKRVKTANNGVYGLCASTAAVQGLMYNRLLAGKDHVELSYAFPYAQLNDGRDQGTSLAMVMRVLSEMGTCPIADCTDEQIFKYQIKKEAYTSALEFKLHDAVVIRNFQQLCSALTLQGPCALSIMIGQNFGMLDSDGVSPVPDITVGGLSLCACGLKRLKGSWAILTQACWGEKYGFDGGFSYITETHTHSMFDGFCYVITEPVVKEEPKPEATPEAIKPQDPVQEPVVVDEIKPAITSVVEPPAVVEVVPPKPPELRQLTLAEALEQQKSNVAEAAIVKHKPEATVRKRGRPKKKQ